MSPHEPIPIGRPERGRRHEDQSSSLGGSPYFAPLPVFGGFFTIASLILSTSAMKSSGSYPASVATGSVTAAAASSGSAGMSAGDGWSVSSGVSR